MLKLFQGKKLAIIGGTGYIGSNIARRAATWGITVYAISRKGTPPNQVRFPSNVHWVKGSAMTPNDFTDILKESHAVIHTVGTLIDTTMMGKKKPGEEGSYEQMNRDTATRVADKLNELNQNHKMVYISANKAPSVLHRYLSTKREAEQHLMNLPNIRTTVLRPGFVVSAQERVWSVPLKYGIQLFNFGLKLGGKLIPINAVSEFLRETATDDPIDLDDLTIAAIVTALGEGFDGKILLGDEMRKVAKQTIERME